MYLICLTCFPDHREFINKYTFRQKKIYQTETEASVYRNILDIVIRYSVKTKQKNQKRNKNTKKTTTTTKKQFCAIFENLAYSDLLPTVHFKIGPLVL